MDRPAPLLACLACAALLGSAPELPAAAAPSQPVAPLHQRIDQLLAAGKADFARRSAGPADDAEFLRRAYLDLTGTVPTAAAARAFLSSTDPDKRRALVDRLLASPEHARHLAHVFDVLLMERRPDRQVPRAAWIEYLRSSFAANKPWDQLTRELLSADGSDAKTRPAAKFFLERGAEPHLLTRDVSRLFLGMNLQCAQCHDHPRVEDYRQEHYYGLFAFLSRTSLTAGGPSRQAVLSEKADGEVTFQSVFDPAKVTKTSLPRVPGGPALKDPDDPKLKGYLVSPPPVPARGGRLVAGGRAVPRYSRRALLAPQLARADYEPFRRNAANRLWASMMGRGLVHPLDMDHGANPASHPELLDLLARELAAHKFDVRWFLRELALSQAYQRSSVPPAGARVGDLPPYAVARLKPLSPEQLAWSLMQATGLTDSQRLALGKGATEANLYARLAGNAAPFVTAFGGPPGRAEGFDARVDQALFLANGPVVRSWLAPRPGNLTSRLAALKGDALAEELYLSVLTRRPDAEERQEVTDFLAARPADRNAALQDLAWALLASAEFRFNH
jgi:hypothetical protein